MKSDLVLHPKTEQAVEQFLQQPAHALLLVGPLGSGKQALALWLAAELLELPRDELQNYPYLLIVDAPTPSVSIETIRTLQQFLRLKTLGTRPIRRIVLLPDVGRMTTEAQNAFLKMLEEPPADTILLLTATSQHELLPTILSRVQTLTVRAVTEAAVKAHFGQQYSEAAVERAYLLSGGLPGLMTALLEQDQSHPLASAVKQAKTILQASSFERLAMVDALAKQKAETAHLLQALQHIARAGAQQAAAMADQTKLARWHRCLKAGWQAQAALQKSANPKLVLTNLMLTL